MNPHVREIPLVLSVAVALTVALTWPLAPALDHAGRIDSGDGRHGVWNVAWVARALTTNPRQLYDANIFHPFQNALAFSEPNIVAGVIAVPAWVVTRNAVAAFNWVTLWSFVLSMLCTFALLRHLTGSWSAGLLAGAMFAFCAYVFSHLPHIQLLLTFGLPLSLLAMHRFVEAPGPRRGFWLGAALAVQALACGYYGIFAAMAVGLGLVWFAIAHDQWRHWRYWRSALLAALVAVAVVAPFLVPFAQIQRDGFHRTLDDARMFSADWRSYLASPKLMHLWILPLIGHWREVLFPGFLASSLALFAIARGARTTRRAPFPASPSVVRFYVVLAALSLWASLGPDAGLYRLLYEVLPFFTLIRAPARFGVLVSLATAVLAGFAIADMERRATGRRRMLLLSALGLLVLARSTVGPLQLQARAGEHPVYRNLALMPRGGVLELPYYTSAFDRHRHTEYMLAATRHWQPLINGHSDHIPPEAFDDGLVLATFPSPAAWPVLQRRQARYIVVHWDRYEARTSPRERIVRDFVGHSLRTVVDRPDMSLYEIVRWPDAPSAARSDSTTRGVE